MEAALKKHLPDGKFKNVPEKRSKAMSAVRGKGNKTTELRLRAAMVQAGFDGWKVRPKGLQGSPDFVFLSEDLVIFVDGCFWHGCPKCGHVPKKNGRFWKEKIKRNRARDRRNNRLLREVGYSVLRFWEHDLSENIGHCITSIRKNVAR